MILQGKCLLNKANNPGKRELTLQKLCTNLCKCIMAYVHTQYNKNTTFQRKADADRDVSP